MRKLTASSLLRKYIMKTTLVDYAIDFVQGSMVVELQEEAECSFAGWYEDGDHHDIAPVSVTCEPIGEFTD